MPECKLTDRAYLTLILSQQWPAEAHRPEVMYDVFLPWLADGTLPRKCVDDPCADYRTAPRANTSSAHCMLETVRYLLRRRGLTVEQCKQFAMMVRHELVVSVQSDMGRLIELKDPNLKMSDTQQKVVDLVLQQLAHKAVKEHSIGRLPAGGLQEIDALGDNVAGLINTMKELVPSSEASPASFIG